MLEIIPLRRRGGTRKRDREGCHFFHPLHRFAVPLPFGAESFPASRHKTGLGASWIPLRRRGGLRTNVSKTGRVKTFRTTPHHRRAMMRETLPAVPALPSMGGEPYALTHCGQTAVARGSVGTRTVALTLVDTTVMPHLPHCVGRGGAVRARAWVGSAGIAICAYRVRKNTPVRGIVYDFFLPGRAVRRIPWAPRYINYRATEPKRPARKSERSWTL